MRPDGASGVELRLLDPATYVDEVPYEYFARLRAETPVQWRDEGEATGFWAVTSYDECVSVNRDWSHFSSYLQGTHPHDYPAADLPRVQKMMLNMDPPLHTRYRRLVYRGFTVRMVRDLEAGIHRAVDDIIDAVCERGEADFVTDISAELPLIVIAELLGVPVEDRHLVFEWSNRMLGTDDPEFAVSPELAAASAREMYTYASELFAQKRINPHPDLMSALTTVEVDGERLTPLELELFFVLLAVAGNETTRNLMTGGLQAFFDHPEQWDLLRADRSLLPGAVEEMLRFVSPVMNFRRTATTDTTLAGVDIGEGDKVMFFHISANRDEKMFDDPNRFDITRDPNPHIAFGGGGPHYCLGANLARVESRIMFEHLLDRVPDIRPTGPAERLRSNVINGIKHLPVAFTPSARVPAT